MKAAVAPSDGEVEAIDRWLGGKRWLVRQHAHYLPRPASRARVYDAFTGGGAVAVHYLRLGYQVVMGDANPRLIGCYAHIQQATDWLIVGLAELAGEHADAQARGMLSAKAHFADVRARMNASDPESLVSAACFLFVLRTGFNGLYRVNRRGVCNTTYGEPKPGKDLVKAEEVRALAKLLERAELRVGDFEAVVAPAKRGDFVYFDPPYVADKGKPAFVAYAPGGFTRKDQARLGVVCRELDGRGVRWLLSDGASDAAGETHGLWHVTRVPVYRSCGAKAASRTTVTELLVSNFSPSRREAA